MVTLRNLHPNGDSIVTSVEHVDSDNSTPGAPTPSSSQSLAPDLSNHDRGNGDSTPVLQLQQGMDSMRLQTPLPNRADSASPISGHGRPSHSRNRRSSSRVHVERHRVDQETLPASEFYQDDFQRALRRSKDLASQLANTLSSANLHTDPTSVIQALHGQAMDASKYAGPTNWKIGLVGDSGAGKSSLINSLLDIEDFARSSNSGAACTCTVTEYHHHSSSEYAIEVVYFPKDEMLEQFKELVQAYRQYHLHLDTLVEGSHEKKELENAANSAWTTLRAAFTDQDLPTEDALKRQDESMIIEQLPAWIDKSAPQGYSGIEGASNTRRECFVDERSCSERLMNLTSTSSAALWPYIKRVNVYLNASILSKGLILVDLPGLHDTNSARKLITERYLVNCNEVFAIANIGRAITDVGVRDVIELARRTKRKHVGIVCTKSDDIRSNEAARDSNGPEANSVRLLRGRVENRRADLVSTEEDIDHCSIDTELAELWRERHDIKTELEALEFKLQECMIGTRNNRVIKDLAREYNLPEKDLFCVSNQIYWTKRKDERNAAMPWLRLSGIINLRLHCLGLVGEHQLRAATSFMKEDIPSLVSSMDLWIQSSSTQIATETRAQVRNISQEIEVQLQRDLLDVLSPSNQLFSELYREFQNWVRTQFNAEADQAWRAGARAAASDWNTWHHGSYAAFCRNYGDHTTLTVGSHCWNTEIIERMIEDLEAPWNESSLHAKAFFQDRRTGVDESLEMALNPLRAFNSVLPDRESFSSVQTLITTLLQRKAMLYTETLGITSTFENAVVQLGDADLLSGIRTSFIGQCMESTYRAAAQDSGRGVHQRQKTVINGKVMHDRNLFESIRLKLETQFHELVLQAEEDVRALNRRHFLAIRIALDTLRNENAAREGELNPEFRKEMRQQVANAQQILRDVEASISG